MAERIVGGAFLLFVALQCAFILYMLGVYLYAPKTPHSWWQFVEESARREAQSRVRSFRIIGPTRGGWIDMGYTDITQRGYGYTFTRDDGSSGEWT